MLLRQSCTEHINMCIKLEWDGHRRERLSMSSLLVREVVVVPSSKGLIHGRRRMYISRVCHEIIKESRGWRKSPDGILQMRVSWGCVVVEIKFCWEGRFRGGGKVPNVRKPRAEDKGIYLLCCHQRFRSTSHRRYMCCTVGRKCVAVTLHHIDDPLTETPLSIHNAVQNPACGVQDPQLSWI